MTKAAVSLRVVLPILVYLSSFLLVQSPALAGNSCECPPLECDSCHKETGVTFYTEKCDDGRQVKSCARPTCVPKDPLPPKCEAAKMDNSPKVKRNVASEKKAAPKAKKQALVRGSDVGTVSAMEGKVWLQPPQGERQALKKGTRVHQQDLIETGKASQMKLVFDDGNVLTLVENSKIRIARYTEKTEPKKKVQIDLFGGKVRSKVKQKYKGTKKSSYEVKTRSAVAGVRGTDFVVSFFKTKDDREITKVETLEGKVKLQSGDKAQGIDLKQGEAGSFVVAANSSDVFDDKEVSEFVARGYMTPVYDLSEKELKKLDWETDLKGGEETARQVASKEEPVCTSPEGQLNQCAWECQNNPKGEKTCRTDLPKVNCVRRRCNANGEWADENRLPASFNDFCKPQGYKVGPCDY